MHDGAAEAALRGDGSHALRLGGHRQRGKGRRLAHEIHRRACGGEDRELLYRPLGGANVNKS